MLLAFQFNAMSILHEHGYDLARAMANLVPFSGPLLCRDEMEEWSASEANLFEEALEKYGKDFNDIRQDFVREHTLIIIRSRVTFSNLTKHKSQSHHFNVLLLCFESCNHLLKLFCLQLQWKGLKDIVEYYYMWKTTDRYVQQVRARFLLPPFLTGSLVLTR